MRVGDRLVLTLGGRRLIFTDNRKACTNGRADACAIYALVANAPGSRAVQKFGFEVSDTTLVDTGNGKQTELTGMPAFSPDGREFVVASFSDESDNNLEVWRRDGDNAKLEWAHPFKQSWTEDPALRNTPANPGGLPPVFRVIAWHGDHVTLAVSTDNRRYRWTGSLTHNTEGWSLSAKSPPGLLP